jgi:hypothetical protein
MRRLVTFLLILIFSAGFCGFFAIQSLVTYARDTDAVVATARSADLRRTGVDLATNVIYDELRSSRLLANVPKQQLAVAVREVMTDDWVAGTVRDAHAGLVAAIDGAGDTAELDLGPTKDSLSRAFAQLGARALAECAAFLGPGPCVSSAKAKVALAAYQASVQMAIRRIPERVDLLAAPGAATDASGPAARIGAIIDVDTLRRRLNDLGALRWLGLAALGVGLVLIALVNWRPAGRTLQATGTALTAAAISYLLLARLVTWLTPRLIAGFGEGVRDQHADAGATTTIVMDGLERMLTELAVRALDMPRGVVFLCAIGGVLLLVASRFFPRGD